MLDLIIRGGDVVTPQGVVQGDVAVAGETSACRATNRPRRIMHGWIAWTPYGGTGWLVILTIILL
jgi:hypothetical protein